MIHIYSAPGALAGYLLVLVLATASCGLGDGALLPGSTRGSTSAGPGAALPLTVGTQFLQALIGGDTDGAAAMIAADRQSPGTTKLLQDSAAVLQGCTDSGAKFSTGVNERERFVSVVLTPACGNRSLLTPSYAGRSPADPVASCQVSLELLSGEWKPRPATIDCQSP